MTTYDSKAEQEFHQRNPFLQYFNKQFPITFFDDAAQPFKACGDFFDAETNTVIEFKDFKLNKHQTKAIAESNLVSGLRFGKKAHYKALTNGWNHSAYKQSKVQSGIKHASNVQYAYLLVFSDTTKLTTPKNGDIALMNSLGINWCYEVDWLESRVPIETTIH